jgi:hypothetical protein
MLCTAVLIDPPLAELLGLFDDDGLPQPARPTARTAVAATAT